jgi:hypothetical protein
MGENSPNLFTLLPSDIRQPVSLQESFIFSKELQKIRLEILK